MKLLFKRPLKKIIIFSLSGLFLFLFSSYLFIAYLLPIPDDLLLSNSSISTKILDRNGKLLYEVVNHDFGRKSYYRLDQMPPLFIQAILSSEDSNFYQHIGVDPVAIARAFLYNSLEQKITSGASTITQQLVRNMFGTNRQRNLQEKLIESIYAIRLSHAYSKDQILEKYLNTVYFGNLAYGAGEAARNYFGKNLNELDLAELTLLAGLPQSPSGYNPLVYPDRAKKRQKYVLSRLLDANQISQQQFDEAIAENLNYQRGKVSIEAPHFVQYVLAELEKQYGEDVIYRQGLTVTTTIDLDLQKKAEEIIDYQLEKLIQKHVTDAALLASDVRNGQILVWVGSADFFNDQIAGQVDVITALRQPGSALKPFLYLLALERGASLSDIIADLPIKIKTDNGIYSPLNYDLDFHGPIRLREALANSLNIPAVKTQEKLGTPQFLSFLRNMGLNTLDQKPDYYGLSLTLGGGEVRLIDLANAYLTLANRGEKRPFSSILKVVDQNNQTIYQWQKPPSSYLLGAHGKSNSFLISDVISDSNARLKSFGEGNILELSFPAAVKTGTTRNFRDNWTMGFSTELLTGVWVGNADATPMENISGIDGAGPIWHDFMEHYHQFHPAAQFARPSDIIQVEICAVSGLLPGQYCQEKINELFLKNNFPQKVDYFWQQFSCDGKIKNLIYYPDEYAKWAEERGYNPPGNCQKTSQETALSPSSRPTLTILSPLNGDVFQLNKNLPLNAQKIAIKIAIEPNTSATRLLIKMDNQVIADQQREKQSQLAVTSQFWLPTLGDHLLMVEIYASDSQKITSQSLQFSVQ